MFEAFAKLTLAFVKELRKEPCLWLARHFRFCFNQLEFLTPDKDS